MSVGTHTHVDKACTFRHTSDSLLSFKWIPMNTTSILCGYNVSKNLLKKRFYLQCVRRTFYIALMRTYTWSPRWVISFDYYFMRHLLNKCSINSPLLSGALCCIRGIFNAIIKKWRKKWKNTPKENKIDLKTWHKRRMSCASVPTISLQQNTLPLTF